MTDNDPAPLAPTPSSQTKKVLIVGASAKIARQFGTSVAARPYELYGTYHSRRPDYISEDRLFHLNLASPSQITEALPKLRCFEFDTVLYFASLYRQDPAEIGEYMKGFSEELQVNVLSAMLLARNLRFAHYSKMIMFGDGGLGQPKQRFTAYSMTKMAVEETSRLLAVELAPYTAVLCLNLGPTFSEVHDPEYYHTLLRVESPVQGLVNFLAFLIAENNFNATACSISYDGGVYNKRV